VDVKVLYLPNMQLKPSHQPFSLCPASQNKISLQFGDFGSIFGFFHFSATFFVYQFFPKAILLATIVCWHYYQLKHAFTVPNNRLQHQ